MRQYFACRKPKLGGKVTTNVTVCQRRSDVKRLCEKEVVKVGQTLFEGGHGRCGDDVCRQIIQQIV